MNNVTTHFLAHASRAAIAAACAALLACAAYAADTEKVAAAAPKQPARATAPAPITPQMSTYVGPTEVGPTLHLVAGKSALVPLPSEAGRLSIGNPEVADVVLINPREAYVVGKKVGTTNVFVWTRRGPTTVFDVDVDLDNTGLQSRLAGLVPGAEGVKVASVADTVVLSGRVSDAAKADRLASLAGAYAGKKVVNLINVDGPQQVLLEVKVAEVSKTLGDKLGVDWNLTRVTGDTTIHFLSGLLSNSASSISGTAHGRTSITLDAEIKNGLVKILAEPNIMAVSGQEGAFLAGGKIYIPVPQTTGAGFATITLEEKEFGVGLRFTPTVLDDGVINLHVTPEVSELSQTGVPIQLATGQVSVLPSINTRRASTTVQLRDGETFAIGGLIKNNVTENVKALPMLGELPVLGALFRSNEFLTDRSELMFIVTPHLVKPVTAAPVLPTDTFVEPTRGEFLLEGRTEGRAPAPAPAGGYQMK